jgi:hypothetical protein
MTLQGIKIFIEIYIISTKCTSMNIHVVGSRHVALFNNVNDNNQ